MGKAFAVVLVVFGMLALWAACASLPALVVMWSWNWLAPQFHSTVHLGFLQAWVGLFALGIVGRVLFGRSENSDK